MEIFIQRFAETIEVDASAIAPTCQYKKLLVWDSLNALGLIALADAQYGVTITGKDIEAAETVSDLWDLIRVKGGTA